MTVRSICIANISFLCYYYSAGPFGKGKMQKPFEESAFKLEINELSDIVETESGVHILLRSVHRSTLAPISLLREWYLYPLLTLSLPNHVYKQSRLGVGYPLVTVTRFVHITVFKIALHFSRLFVYPVSPSAYKNIITSNRKCPSSPLWLNSVFL